jgi:hypothetical protein
VPERAIAALLGSCAIPVGVLAVAAVTGLGLVRNLPALPSLLVGVALVVLPVVGLVRVLSAGTRLAVVTGVAWVWSLGVLLALPFYFPGERQAAASMGLSLLAAPLPEAGRSGLLSTGAWIVDLLGSEPEPTPLAGALPPPGAELARAADDARQLRAQREARGEVVIAYEGRGESLRVDAFFDGPRYGEEFVMIFDTGATYTTLSRAALALLEVDVPPDAPIAVLRTANGEIEAPLVQVDAVWLGDAVVEWVTIAVCDLCASEETAGLLGLNVHGQFQVSLDHDHRMIRLAALGNEEDRKLDVGQWLRLRSRLLRWRDGRLEVEVSGENRGRVAIREFAAEVECPGGRFEVLVDRVAPNAKNTRTMALPRGTDCSEYTLSLRRALWERARFSDPVR